MMALTTLHVPVSQDFRLPPHNFGPWGAKFLGISQHELHLWIYYTSKFLNTSEFIIMINSRQILNLS